MIFNEFLKYNADWAEKKLSEDREYFKRLSAGQNPEILMIGCSDSRVSLEKILGVELGELFIHRNIANQVNIIDINFLSVLEYAINHLKIKHIVIMGHYDCGGVKAAVNGDNHSLTENWVMPVRELYLQHSQELKAIADKSRCLDRLAEINAIKQAENIFKTSVMQRAVEEKRAPQVHAWIFDIYTGKIKELELEHLQ